MYVYWGSNDSGKAHVKHYAMVNNKTNLLWHNNYIKKIHNIVHHHEEYWRDEQTHRIIYHNINGFRSCQKIENRIWRYESFSHTGSSINPNHKRINYGPRDNKTKKHKGYTKEHIEKYTQIEYVNTNVYFDIISKYVENISDEMNHNILIENYNEILNGVDLITFILPKYVIHDIQHNLRNACNIIPFKSNILDSIISKLDGFNNFRTSEYNNNVLQVYNTDKNRVWDWLDSFQIEMNNTIKTLIEYDIPYQMFDLDTDSYKDTFGWDIEIDRKFSHRQNSWDCNNNENYKKIENIAKEYITLRKL
tara:strand:+ start:2716 stop:3633 length:918 start_codon:yes stop_codon:yes gene_type:complete